MKKTLFLGAITALLFVQCAKEQDPFAIANGSIGKLTKEIQMKQVDSIFAKDSLVRLSTFDTVMGTRGEVEIYEKGGQKLLLLSPNDEQDPASVVGNIQIFDARYVTDKGLNVKSTFGDLKANYEIASVQTTINAVVVFLKNSDIYVTIDKKQLPENLRYNIGAKIEATQIPNEATFKYFMVGWDAEENETNE